MKLANSGLCVDLSMARHTGDKASSSIFGAAKPVDTAAREKEIEDKLAKHQDKEKEGEEMVRCSRLGLQMHGNRIPHWLS